MEMKEWQKIRVMKDTPGRKDVMTRSVFFWRERARKGTDEKVYRKMKKKKKKN